MHVFRDQHDRSLCSQTLEEDQERIEEPALCPFDGRRGEGALAVTGDELRDKAPELAGSGIDDRIDRSAIRHAKPPAKGLCDGGERQPFLGADADAAALEHEVATLSSTSRDLGDEPALADAGFAADED